MQANNDINMNINDEAKSQKYLGKKGFIAFIAILSAFIPLSTDIYLPALPRMVGALNTTSEAVNMTLLFFFIFFAVGTMFWGPLSDKYGRRAILITGMVIYTLASLLCVFSTTVTLLIAFRVMQAIGCGAATAVGTAIVKDSFYGRKRLTVLAIVQSMGMLSPIIAPVIGAFILKFMSWRGVFVFLAILGVLSLLGSLALEDTIDEKYEGSILSSLGNLVVVSKNKGFMMLMITFSIMSIATMSFITSSAFIFEEGFHLSASKYSIYFAINAVFFMIGPLLYVQLSKRFKSFPYINTAYIVSSISGLLMILVGNLSPNVFMLTLIPTSFLGSLIRPQTASLILDQIKEDAGAASSIMNWGFTFFGSIGMLLISNNMLDKITTMGLMYLVTSIITLILWNVSCKKYVY